MKRYKHNLSNYRLTTLDIGQLIPVQLQEVLPGDTLQLNTSSLIRLSPMLAPVMHPITVRFHHWFVPNRIIWDKWEDFITGTDEDLEIPTLSVDAPTTPGDDPLDLLNYFGVPRPQTGHNKVNVLPIRAFNMIYNEFYRDEDLVSERKEDDITIPRVSWRKDYFTSARPWQQKGTQLTLPIGDRAPVVFDGHSGGAVHLENSNGDGGSFVSVASGQPIPWASGTTSGSNLIADLSQSTGITAVDFREFFAMQRYQEARSRYGSRYTEYLRYLGVNPSDARLQLPEYIGGGKTQLQISEVLQTSDQGSNNPLGKMGGHGISALKTRRARKFFEEHGYVITVMSVVPKSIYMDGYDRTWFRKDKEDFFQRELQDVGQQPIYQGEVYAKDPTAVDDVFGYQDRYSEYTHTPSKVTGEFRTILDFWHLGRTFANKPALNSTFIECSPSKRIFAEQNKNSLWVLVNNKTVARRPVKNTITSRLV